MNALIQNTLLKLKLKILLGHSRFTGALAHAPVKRAPVPFTTRGQQSIELGLIVQTPVHMSSKGDRALIMIM